MIKFKILNILIYFQTEETALSKSENSNISQDTFQEITFDFNEHQKMLKKLHSSPGMPAMLNRPMFLQSDESKKQVVNNINVLDIDFFCLNLDFFPCKYGLDKYIFLKPCFDILLQTPSKMFSSWWVTSIDMLGYNQGFSVVYMMVMELVPMLKWEQCF